MLRAVRDYRVGPVGCAVRGCTSTPTARHCLDAMRGAARAQLQFSRGSAVKLLPEAICGSSTAAEPSAGSNWQMATEATVVKCSMSSSHSRSALEIRSCSQVEDTGLTTDLVQEGCGVHILVWRDLRRTRVLTSSQSQSLADEQRGPQRTPRVSTAQANVGEKSPC